MKTEKITKLVETMRSYDIDCLILSHQTHLLYLTGLRISPGDRLFAAVVKNGELYFVCNRMLPMPEDIQDSVVWYHDCDNGIYSLSSLIPHGARVGIDSGWPYGYFSELTALRGDLVFTNGSVCMDELRMVKSEQELELLRRSSEINDMCMRYIVGEISDRLTEAELADMLFSYHDSLGYGKATGGAIISYGVNAVDPHHFPDSSRLHHGDNIVMDFGFLYRDYFSDMTRTVFYRHVSDELRRICGIVLEAQEAAFSVIRPGCTAGEVDGAARAVISACGYGEYFPHRTGHGIGLDVHEPPFITGASPLVLKPGMVFSVEPGIYIPGVGGVRIEDLVIVTDTGYENLNTFPKELLVI